MVDFGDRVRQRDGTPVPPPPGFSRRFGVPTPSERKPVATWALLGTMLVVWLVEQYLRVSNQFPTLRHWFIVDVDWLARPWSPLTSTLAHDPFGMSHLLFNGLFLYFVGSVVERIIGPARYVTLFLIGGMVSGILQAHIGAWLDPDAHGALGASGGLMMLFAILAVLLPRMKMYIYGILPMPMWGAAVGYMVIDVLGVFDPFSRVGHFAHLGGFALGLAAGWHFRQDLKRRGLRLVGS